MLSLAEFEPETKGVCVAFVKGMYSRKIMKRACLKKNIVLCCHLFSRYGKL